MHPLHQERPVAAIDPDNTQSAIASDATAARIQARGWTPVPDQMVGVRLNLNILKSTGKAVQTIHEGAEGTRHTKNRGFWSGDVLGYAEAVTLKDAYFNVHQEGRERIAADLKNKFPMASVDGRLVRVDSEANRDGVEVRFNPKQSHLFVDGENRAIHYAEEVTILGHRAYARGRILYHTADTAPKRAGEAPSIAQLCEQRELDVPAMGSVQALRQAREASVPESAPRASGPRF